MTSIQELLADEVLVVRRELVSALADTLRKARFATAPKEKITADIVHQVQAIVDDRKVAAEVLAEDATVRLLSSHSLWFRNALSFYHSAKTEEKKEESVVFLITASHDYCRSAIPEVYAFDAPRTDEVVELDIRALEMAKATALDALSGSLKEEESEKFHYVARYLFKVEESGKGKAADNTLCTVDAGLFSVMMSELKVGNDVDRIEQRTRKNLLNLILTIHDLEEVVDFSIQIADQPGDAEQSKL